MTPPKYPFADKARDDKYFYPVLALTIFTVFLLQFLGSYLKTPEVPNGIFALKFKNCDDCIQAVKLNWSSSCGSEGDLLSYAFWTYGVDLLFPLFYCTLLYFLFIRIIDTYIKRKDDIRNADDAQKATRVAIFLVPLICLVDWVENSSVLYLLIVENASPVKLIFWSSTILLILLILMVAYSIYAFLDLYGRKLIDLAKTLYYCRFSLITIFLLYFLLWVTPQGQDLLISMNEKAWHVVALFVLLTILAAMNWLVPRFLISKRSEENMEVKKKAEQTKDASKWCQLLYSIFGNLNASDDSENYKEFNKIVPRLMGLLTILVVYGAIVNVMDIIDCEGVVNRIRKAISPGYQVALGLTFGIILSTGKVYERLQNIYQRNPKRSNWIILIVAILLFLSFLLLARWNEEEIADLTYLSIALAVLAIIFFLGVTFRRKLTKERAVLSGLKCMPVSAIVFGSMIVVSVAFFIMNIWAPGFILKVGAIGITIASLIFHMGLIIMFTYFWRKAAVISFFAVLFFAAIGFTVSMNMENHYHDVDLVKTNLKPEDRLNIKNYFINWILDRRASIDKTTEYPVILLSTNGGGTRAAFWTALLNSRIYDKTKGKYTEHLFSQSGASGGIVGSAVFTALCDYYRDAKDAEIMQEKVEEIYNTDLLASTIAFLFGKDFWQVFIPFNLEGCRDRSEQLLEEYGTQMGLKCSKSNPLSKPITALWYKNNQARTDLPLYFGNTMSVEKGRRAIISPIKLENDFLEAIDLGDLGNDTLYQTMTLGSAAMLTNRFPFVNPAGRIEGKGHFVDGGYFDNTGGSTTMDILTAISDTSNLFSMVNKQDSLAFREAYEKLRFYIMKIDNDGEVSQYKQDTNVVEYSENIPEVLVPPMAAYNSILVGRVKFTDSYLEKMIDAHPKSGDYFDLWLPYAYNPRVKTVNEGEEICKQLREKGQRTCETLQCDEVLPLGRSLSNSAREKMIDKLDDPKVSSKLDQIIELIDKAHEN